MEMNFTEMSVNGSVPIRQHCFKSPSLEPVSSVAVQQFIFALYLCTSVLSILGNTIVIVVQLLGRESSRSIRKYLLNLSASDITLSLMSMPFTYSNIVLGHWPHSHWLCPTAQFAQLLSVFITSTTLSLIGIERYIITIHPLSQASHWLKSHTKHLLLCLWFFGALYAYFPIANTYATKFTLNGKTFYQCNYRNKLNNLNLQLFIAFNFVFTFFLPLLIITFSYAAIIRKINGSNHFIARYSKTKGNSSALIHKSNKTSNSNHCTLLAEKRSKSIKIMFAVIVAYCICWLPVKVFQFLSNLRIITYCTESEFYIFMYLYLAFHWLAMSSSLINPIIYGFLSKSFRNDFWKIVKSYIFIPYQRETVK